MCSKVTLIGRNFIITDIFILIKYFLKFKEHKHCIKQILFSINQQIVSTHFEAECNEEKKCPKNKYCRNFHCFEAHRKHHECDENDECADDMPCIYGRCDDKPKGSPGKDDFEGRSLIINMQLHLVYATLFQLHQ